MLELINLVCQYVGLLMFSNHQIAVIEQNYESRRQDALRLKRKSNRSAWARIRNGEATEQDKKLKERSRRTQKTWKERHYEEHLQRRRQLYRENKGKIKSNKVALKLHKTNVDMAPRPDSE